MYYGRKYSFLLSYSEQLYRPPDDMERSSVLPFVHSFIHSYSFNKKFDMSQTIY